ncbi:uncharacterized protein si:dkey-163f14.6 isoform X2 [Cololabis saira]|uniref:uncharacterized protein si:dkey-163f14.6 isoform X2 n=1 Tax=Cololabis saira TaxID=129043 RepID=UPI002AD3CA63|nr:uncharacterized protein si:dkey-163f14.6 isoform X2 [Cololabis saira]
MGPLAALVALVCFAVPVCGDMGSCNALRNLDNGQTFFRYGGLLVIFQCNPGYKLHGYKSNSCVSGHWSRDPPVCVGSGCSDPGEIIHGTSSVNQDGSWAVYSCNSGFHLHGPSMLYCKGHSWNSTKPVCKETDIMSSVSSINVGKSNSYQNLQSSAGVKSRQHSHSDIVTKAASKEVDVKFGLLPSTPTSLFNSERMNVITTEIPPKTHDHITSLKAHDVVQANQGSGKRGSEVTMSREEVGKMEEVTQISATKHSLSITVSSALSSASETEHSTFSPSSFSSTHAPAVTTSTNVALRQTSLRHYTNVSLPVLGFKEAAPSQDNVTPSEVVTAGNKVQQAESGFKSPFLPQTQFIEQNKATDQSHETTLDFSTSSPATSAFLRFTLSNMKSQLPDGNAVPSYISNNTDLRSTRTENNNFTMTFKPISPFLNVSRQPVCPYPPVPAHGTYYFYNVENPGPRESRQYIQYTCYPGYTLAHGDVHSYCQQGGTWSGVTPVCLDLTPCSINNGGCSQLCSPSQMYNQSSNQTQTTVKCHCKPGFTLLDDGLTCRDIDECAVNLGLGPCLQRCHNSPGSYRCSCTFGHILAGDGHSCIAECPAGYRKQPTTPPENSTTPSLNQKCLDINECLEETCEWQCINLPGSHRCICPRGYTLQKDGQRCKDVNECSRENGGCSHLCVNRRGGHKCACPASHRLSPYSWKTCLPRETANTAG